MIYSEKYHIQLGHFTLWNSWHINSSGGKLEKADCPCSNGCDKFIVDETTNDSYLNDPAWLISVKCAGVALIAMPVHFIGRFASLAHIIKDITQKNGPFLYNITRVVSALFIHQALLLAAVYGIVRPLDGRKLYASFERFFYQKSVIPDCFQPSYPGYSRIGHCLDSPQKTGK